MVTVYRAIVNHSHWLVVSAVIAPLMAGLVAWTTGGAVIESMAFTAFAVIIAGAIFGLVGLAICVVALMWVMISLAFGI